MVRVSPEKVATPSDAVAVSVPPKVPPPGLFASATVTVPLNEVIGIARAVLGLDRQTEGAACGDAGRRLLRHHQLRCGQGGDADRVRAGIGEPEVAVGAGRDRVGRGAGVRDGVLGDGVGRRVDHPDRSRRSVSANQRLPSGPAVIPTGSELAVGWRSRLMASVVGLIVPTSAPRSGEPEVAVGPRGDSPRSRFVVAEVNSVMTWVVGLICPLSHSAR